MYDGEPLFTEHDLSAMMREQSAQMIRQINAYPADALLDASPEGLAADFADRYGIQAVRLLDDQISVDHEETEIDLGRRSSNRRSRPDGRARAPGTRITFHVPFEGDPEVFKCTPATRDYSPPYGHVQSNLLEIAVVLTNHDVESGEVGFKRALSKVCKYLAWAERDLTSFNAGLREIAKQHIDARRTRLLKARQLVAALGYPLRRREDALTTYVTPKIRRKIPPLRPTSRALCP